MDIEKLTKSQIVLLTLLISFVTSIATGIVTVSLMQQAPPAVAETVNRVIEHTIETVASSTPKGQSAATVVTQEKTVVVNESDLIVHAVKQVTPSVVRIYADSANGSGFLGLGIVIDASGTIATDISALADSPDATLTLSNGTSVRAFVTSRDSASGLLYLTPATSSAATLPNWTPATLTTSDPDLGESVVALSGDQIPQIGEGLVTRIVPADSTASTPKVISTDIPAGSIMPGSPVIDTNGNVVGVSTGVSRASSPSGFIPALLMIKDEVKEARWTGQ
jgi:S1-C subfamily serine protease